MGSGNKTNPCNPADGSKNQAEIDYTSGAGLSFVRFYNSMGPYKTAPNMGAGWRHSYSRSIDEEPDRMTLPSFAAPHRTSGYSTASDACTLGWNEIKADVWGGDLSSSTATFVSGNTCRIESGGSTVAYMPIRYPAWIGYAPGSTVKTVTTAAGQAHEFELDGTDWINELDSSVTLEASGSNWIFTDANDTKETYNSSGQLTSIARRNGQTTTLDYALSVTQGGDGDSSTLDRVTGPFGHELTFTYANGLLDSVTTPDGAISYTYDSNDNLTNATYPDTTSREYHYERPTILPNHLTGITDENGIRFATWEYDLDGLAVASEHAGGKERVDLSYNSNGTTTLTDANGSSVTYTFGTEQGERKLTSLSGDVCSTCPGGNIKSRDYDSNGFLSELTDWNNNVTKTTRNSRGLTETLVEGFGSTAARTTTTIWHADYRLPTKVTTPRNVTDYTHDTSGNVLTATVSGGGKTRAWTFTYNASGQVLTIDGPRTDVTDTTTLEYYACSSGDECGRLKKVTNALGHITNYDSYDAAGRLTEMTDANGLATTYTYDLRGRPLTITETPTAGTPRVTTMTYDDVGQLKTYTLPNGTVLTYAYTDARYLDSITDNLGNSIDYGYDAMGNLTDEDTYDPLSALKQSLDYVIDRNDRLDSSTHGPVSVDVTFDDVGNLLDETDGNSRLTQHVYDALNRLDTTTDAKLGLTDYDYDDHDNVTQVVAPNGATTIFAYDLLDNLTSETSPDRGTVTYTYDDAGSRLTQTDARGITGTYTYDALNRPTSVTYPNTAENITFTYDHAGSEGIGRLRSIADQTGTITLSYNEFGKVITDARLIGSNTYTTTYAYDAAGNVSSMTYPSGRTVAYTRNAIGQVTGVTSTRSAVQKTIVSNAAYEPFGPVASVTYGNGAVFNYVHRQDYRLDGFSSGTLFEKDYLFDAAGNIKNISDIVDSGLDQTLTYDELNRITEDSRPVAGSGPTYQSTVLGDSPALYWRLGETAGPTAVDVSGNLRDGTYSGTNVPGQTALITDADTSTQFNTNAGNIAGPVMTGVSLTGVETWIQTDSTSSNQFFLGLHDGGGNVRTHIYHRAGGYIYVWRDHATIITSNAPVSAAQPHHIALWYESGTNTTYLMVDGVTQTGTYSGDALSMTNPELWIGGQRYNGVNYKLYQGKMDEVALYDTAVSASTFSNHYTAGTSAGPSSLTLTFTYDANGNRSTLDDGTTVTSYSYAAATNKLTGIAGSTVQRDASGNRTADVGGTRTYTYNNQNRLSAVLDSGATTASYVHNALGQRTKKTVGSSDVIYIYDLGGNLIAEHDATGALIRDYVWMNGTPVAQIDAGETFSYLHFDHLGTPRLATNDSQTIVWRWDSDAFGTTLPDEDPDGDSNGTTVNLRFPGQYFDAESGFHYNYYRTYDPTTGRYLESDPIGLAAGLNTYGYVSNVPTMRTDRFGLYEGGGVQEVLGTDYGSYTDALAGLEYVPPDRQATMYGAEGHFILGGGLAAVTCDDECGETRVMRFAKVCVGGAAGASGGLGTVTGLGGERCRQENYQGWFFEGGGTIGNLSAGADIGFNTNSGLPYGMSGVNEYHAGPAPKIGAQVKATWCYYIPLQ